MWVRDQVKDIFERISQVEFSGKYTGQQIEESYAEQQRMADYTYRISLHPWIFIAAAAFCLAVAFITVFYQSYQAANQNPVKNVKTEWNKCQKIIHQCQKNRQYALFDLFLYCW